MSKCKKVFNTKQESAFTTLHPQLSDHQKNRQKGEG